MEIYIEWPVSRLLAGLPVQRALFPVSRPRVGLPTSSYKSSLAETDIGRVLSSFPITGGGHHLTNISKSGEGGETWTAFCVLLLGRNNRGQFWLRQLIGGENFRPIIHNFLQCREVTHRCSYRSTCFCIMILNNRESFVSDHFGPERRRTTAIANPGHSPII